MQQAFITALSKPMNERPSIHDEKKFTGWMCEMTKYAALTLRLYVLRRAKREIATDEDVAERASVAPLAGAVEARKMVCQPFIALNAEEQKLLHALFLEENTIEEWAQEEQRPWATVFSRKKRILDLLYMAIRASLMMLVLLPKRARAFVAQAVQRAPQTLVQAKLFGGTIAATGVCGVLWAASSSAMNTRSVDTRLTSYIEPQTTSIQSSVLEPSSASKVEREEPKAVDAETNECSAADMTSSKFATVLQKVLVPTAVAVTPVLTHVGCAGTEQQTQCPQEPMTTHEEEEEARRRANDAYESACLFARARGETCIPQEEWKKHGRRE